MRFALSAALLALVGATSAVVIERQTGGILKCMCLADKNNSKGTLIGTTDTTYTCSYANGACTWVQLSGTLVNDEQPNCYPVAPCL